MLKRALTLSCILGLLLFLLPLLCIRQFAAPAPQREDLAEPETPAAEGTRDKSVTLRVEIGGAVQELPLSDYLMGVVRAEMPARFEAEALKAQTVAARTYTLYQMAHGSAGKHESGADLCDDPTCCQAYISLEKAQSNWGEQAAAFTEKIAAAEAETDGEVLLYGGEPILAVFHSSSAEGTEDAAAAWSSDVPYLKSVKSPEDAESVPNYVSDVTYTAKEFRDAVLASYPEAKLTGSPEGWITELQRDEAGYVSSLRVGGIAMRGVALRRVLGLRSACFTVTAGADTLMFRTTGYGHGVGMSQYGANALAAAGRTYREILQWYYTGVTLGQNGN